MPEKSRAPLAGGDRAGVGDAGRHSDTISWRETLARLGITVATKAEPYRILEGADLASLAADIDANGLRNPLVLWRAKDGDPWQLADGRNRCAAMATLIEGNLQIEGAVSLANRFEGIPFEPLVRSLNIERRHLSAEEKRELIGERLVAAPALSDRQIAKETWASHHTVANVRNGLEGCGQIAHVSQRTDTTGRQQPSHKTTSAGATRQPAPKVSPATERDQLVGNICKWLRNDLRGALDSLVLIFRDERRRMADLPRDKRVIIARGIVHALDIEVDDLKAAL